MIEKQSIRMEQNLVQGAHAALDVFRADTPRAADLVALLDWVDEHTLCRTWATLIGRSFEIHDDPLVACCQAGRTIITDYYSRPPLVHECISDIIKNSLSEIIGGAIFATLKPQASETARSSGSLRS